MPSNEYLLFGLGNPLLDAIATMDPEILDRYGLEANNACLAEDKHLPLYDEIAKHPTVIYLAGGAAQNALRGAQYCLPPKSTVYVGCVGNDKYADELRAANEREGVRSEYMVTEGPTGICGAIVTGHHRSLVTNLAAANNYKVDHLKSPEIWRFVETTQFYYVGGYHLTVCVDAITALGEHAAEKNKACNQVLIESNYPEQMDNVSKYWDYIIGNESEAESYANFHYLHTTDLKEIAKYLALLPKVNTARQRVVVITQGANPTIVVTAQNNGTVQIEEHEVTIIPDDQIVDTVGAGDAFSGAFIASLVQGRPVSEAVQAGHWLASLCIRQPGPAYPYPKQTFVK
ncbi:Adenosine kinase [Neolecta irregularis DAH-3]|uniref:Adenosine kinase n=1 Tax=Neolecta irregularis (strain DAH-3) TaxID=1198029 RepID=A0A1U7LI02_NEOID|nr:Adenosine kinase [Neolecta irregularis DAH-3]|eukprot:OLL22258.1 Adenosine kinase [Neolecta irregularis DAH-3]